MLRELEHSENADNAEADPYQDDFQNVKRTSLSKLQR